MGLAGQDTNARVRRQVEGGLRCCRFDGQSKRYDGDLGYQLYQRVAPILVHQLEATQLQLLDLYRTEG
jgi:hypothetical protein